MINIYRISGKAPKGYWEKELQVAKKQLSELEEAMLSLMLAVGDTIRAISKENPGPLPQSPIYLAMQAQGYTLNMFNVVLSGLEELNVIKKTAETVTWIGPDSDNWFDQISEVK